MKNKLNAFTLLETILYIGLFSAVLFIVLSFMLSTQEANMRTERSENIYQSSQFITEHINYTFGKAESINEANSLFEDDNGKLSLIVNSEVKTYEIESQKLIYDSIQISSSDIIVENFYLTPLYKDLEIIGVKINIKLRDKEDSKLTEEINLLSTLR